MPTAKKFEGPAPRAVLMIDSSTARSEAGLTLLSVANRPVILRVLDSFREAGVREVVVAVEPRSAAQIHNVLEFGQEWPFPLSYMHSPTGEGLLDALSRVGHSDSACPLLARWACGLFNSPLASLLRGATVGPLDAVLVVDPPSSDSAVIELASGRLAALLGDARAGSQGRLAGLALLGARAPEVARELRPGRGSDEDVVTLVERMTELGGRPRVVPAGACWRYSGGRDSALELNRFLLSGLVAESSRRELPGTVVQGAVQIDPSATLERSTIRGPVMIGARARLIDAWVGPYTSIAEDVRVEGAEVENSIVLAGVRISHLDRRVEASVIGPGAVICRDFRLPHALRLNVGEGATVSLT